MKIRRFRSFAWFICISMLVSVSLYAQTTTSGVVTGQVTDQSGAVIPGASVTLVDASTGLTVSATTGSSGRYVFPTVSPGTYVVRVEKTGFQTSEVSSVLVEASKSYKVDVKLQLGQVTQAVTVTATTGVELQTTNATVGNSLNTTALTNLPSLARSATSLVFLQPGVNPNTDSGNTGGQIAGAISDQVQYMVDGGDATDQLNGNNTYATVAGGNSSEPGSSAAALPIPIEMTQAFRVSISGQNSTFARASGGVVNVETKRGSNQFHGMLYEYHNDDALNANTWASDATGVAKPHSVDNRFGANIGGPVNWPLGHNKLWFFAGWEEHRYHDAATETAVIPTSSFRDGIIEFPNTNGTIMKYSLVPGSISSNCGSNGTSTCDPRSLGMSTVISSQLGLYSKLTPNDPALGDGYNTTGYLYNVATPTLDDIGAFRLDNKINSKWSWYGTYHMERLQRTTDEQVDVLNSAAVASSPDHPWMVTLQLTGQISPNFNTVFHGSLMRSEWSWSRVSPAPLVSGTDYALLLEDSGYLTDPITISTASTRQRIWDDHNWYIGDDSNYVHGNQVFQFGAAGYIDHAYLQSTSAAGTGGVSQAPENYLVPTSNDGNYLNVDSVTPPRCPSSGTVTNCIPSSYADHFNALYTMALGMVDRVSQVESRNGQFQPYPLGTPPFVQTSAPSMYLYAQDIWQMKRDLTATLGLNWGVPLPVSEASGKQAAFTYVDTGQALDLKSYISQREVSLEQQGVSIVNGTLNAYNPLFGITPVNALPSGGSLPRGDLTVTPWNEFGPRLSVAWNVPYSNWLFGHNHNTVIRGGYSIVYNRITGIVEDLYPISIGGFAQPDICGGPTAAGICTGGETDPTTAFRIGPDGKGVAVPTPTASAIPYVPAGSQADHFGIGLSFPQDPFAPPGHSHNVDFSIERSLHGGMLLDVGFIGRYSRGVPAAPTINAPDYRTKDAKSGQTYAQAFDAVAQALRNGANVTAVPDEPFFDDLIGLSKCQNAGYANCSQLVAAKGTSDLIDGAFGAFGLKVFDELTPGSMDNLQGTEIASISNFGWANYNAGYVSLKKSTMTGPGPLNGLEYQFNLTWSHALGTQGETLSSPPHINTPYNPGLDYANATFDRPIMTSAWWYWQLPFGTGREYSFKSALVNRIVGGWYWSGVWTMDSGLPYCVNANGDFGRDAAIATCAIAANGFNLSGVSGTDHTGVTGSDGIGTHTLGLNAFSDPAAVFNNLARPLLSTTTRIAHGSLRGPVNWDMDFSFGKNIAVTERYKVIFSADLLNAFNHPNFGTPSASLNSRSTFGVFSSQDNTPRQVQFGLRVEF